MSKRILSLVLALVMVLGTFGTVFAAEPAVATVEKDAATFLKEAKVLLGDDKGDLNLDLKLERRDMVILLSRLMGEEEVASKFPVTEISPTWEDVRSDAYYLPVLAWGQVNKFFEGKTAKAFGPREAMTAQDYSLVLLRALGYEVTGHDAWKAALADAKELGILTNVVVEDATEITRGQMSVMTLNALAVNVKDSTKTLAETLEIVLPTPSVLEVEEVVADNLMEVKVSFNKDVDVDLTDVELFSIKGLTITDASVEGDMVILSLKEKMTNKKAYELVIKGTTEVDGTYKFTANDNAIPAVVSVEGLGTKAVKVVMSEPVKDAKTTNFKLNGKTVYGTPQTAGREIVLKVYTDLKVGENELTVRNLEDFNGFKSLETTHDFDVAEDNEKPTVASADAWLERVVVTFSEDVDHDTVSRYSAYWKSGSTKKYPETFKRLAGNKYEFGFSKDNSLPAHETTLYVEGVKDYSGNKMDVAEIAVKALIDTTRPEVTEVEVKSDKITIEIKFNKNLNEDTVEKISNYTVLDSKDNKSTISEATLKDPKTVSLVLGKALSENQEYTLKVSGLQDNNKYENTMIDYSEKISVGNFTGPKLDYVTLDATQNGQNKVDGVYKAILHLFFTKDMDLSTLSNPENYLVQIDNSNRLLSKLDNNIDIIKNDGRVVVIRIESEKKFEITGIAGLGLEDSAGKELANYGEMKGITTKTFTIESNKAVAVAKDKVEIEFTMAVDSAPRGAFSGLGVEVKEVEISKNVVTLILDGKLPADANKTLKIDKERVTSFNGEELAIDEIALKDEIKPSIKEVTLANSDATNDEFVVYVEFDEEVTTGGSIVFNEANWKTDLVVKKVVGDEKVAYGLSVANVAGKNVLVITIDAEDIAVDTAIQVAVEDARFITDVSGNKAANSLGRTNKIVGLKDALAVKAATEAVDFAVANPTKANVDAAQALVTALVDGAAKIALQDRIDDIDVVPAP